MYPMRYGATKTTKTLMPIHSKTRLAVPRPPPSFLVAPRLPHSVPFGARQGFSIAARSQCTPTLGSWLIEDLQDHGPGSLLCEMHEIGVLPISSVRESDATDRAVHFGGAGLY